MPELRSHTLTRQTGAVVGRDVERWQDAAACRDEDVELFFEQAQERGQAKRDRVAMAKAVCRGCPVRAQCLEYAQTTRQDAGIWGGLDEGERAELRKQAWRPQ